MNTDMTVYDVRDISKIDLQTLLSLCSTMPRVRNIVIGVALGYSSYAIARWVLESVGTLPMTTLPSEYVDCGFTPDYFEQHQALEKTVTAINSRRWFEQPFDKYRMPHDTPDGHPVIGLWNILRGFATEERFRDQVLAVIKVISEIDPEAIQKDLQVTKY